MSTPRRPPPPMIESWLTVPSAFSSSAGCILIVVPAGTPPSSRSSGQPAKFWPRSNTHTPGFGSVMLTGRIRSTTSTGSAARQTRAVVRLGGGAMPARTHPTGEPS